MPYIYALIDPRDEAVRYIGKASDVRVRYQQHCCRSTLQRARTHKERWLAALDDAGHKPVVAVLAEVSEEDWSDLERAYIATARQIGYPLTNGDEGGLGGQTGPEKPIRYMKRLIAKTYTDLLKMGFADHAKRVAAMMRRKQAERPDVFPKKWATVGLVAN